MLAISPREFRNACGAGVEPKRGDDDEETSMGLVGGSALVNSNYAPGEIVHVDMIHKSQSQTGRKCSHEQ